MGSSPGSVCRICLAVDVQTVTLSDTSLQDIFEKVSNTPLHTDDMRPVEACLVCRSQLKKCWRLMLASEKSENILTEISERCNMITKESIALIDRNVNGLCHSLCISRLECIDNLLPDKDEDIKKEIKLEKDDKECLAGALHTEEVDISDIYMRDCDSDEEDDLPLKSLSIPKQAGTKIEFSIFKSEDADDISDQKSEAQVENETELEIPIEDISTNTNERESPINLLKPFKKAKCNICLQWYPNKYMEKHAMTHTDIRPFECKVCKNQFRLIHHLKRHMETVHTADEKPPVVRNKTYTCDICRTKFQTKMDCLKHYKTHTYVCDYCQQPYKNKAYLIQHLKIHTGEKSLECRICHVQFNGVQYLNRHCRLSHNITTNTRKPAVKNQTYKCSMCVSIFFNRRDYFKHLRTHTYECNECHQRFKNKGYLTQHIRIHTGDYECNICHMRFINKVFLSRHARLIHNINFRKKVVRNQKYTCALCGSDFFNKKVFYKHARIHKYKCDQCQKEYPNKAHLIKHLNVHVEKEQFECSICQWQFKTKANMSRHIKSHEEPSEKLHECEYCQRRYNLGSDLTRHLKTHTTEKPFECDICQRRYISMTLLRRHHRTHTREKTLECEACHKLFATNLQLRNHRRTHTGEKPYGCSVCQRRFSHKSVLSMHFRSHTGEKPYVCKLCPATYAHRSGLRLHLRKHTGEELPVKCDMCEMRFAKKCQLVEHYRKHTGEKPFTCTLCDGRFASTRSLNKHLRLRVCSES